MPLLMLRPNLSLPHAGSQMLMFEFSVHDDLL